MNNKNSGIKIYFSSCPYSMAEEYNQLCPNDELNILISYGICDSRYLNMNGKKRHIINSLISDSGTFSINSKKGKHLNRNSLNGFIDFCKPLFKKSDFFMNYDEDFTIDGFKKNYRNMKILEDNGVNVVPIVHDYLSENIDEIDIYLNENYKIIALGDSPHKRDKKNKIKNITYAVNRIVDGGAMVHLLGVTDSEILKDIPVHFCDSTSWATEQRAGVIKWWNPHYSKTDNIYMLDKIDSEFRHKNHIGNYQNYDQFEEYLDDLNINITDLMGYRRSVYRKFINMKYFITMQNIIRDEHKQKGFKMD